ncbi:hypothetical protein ABZ646_46245, partial [Streptomyces sp. NPDC007162]|uniref:hypothetical protein n=1 Tax=Streptomyces sp. NPDC007162 TaxID=3156917 RepID=UPI0033D421F1
MTEIGEGVVQHVDEEVGRGDVDAERRLDLEDVEMVSRGLDDHPEVEHAVGCARQHGLDIDYLGGWNERGYDIGWYEKLHA